MSLIGVEEGIQAYGFPNFLDAATNALKLHLFTNNMTPAANSVLANFTECTDGSYAAVALVGGNWVLSSITGPAAQAAYPMQTFTFAGANNLYGYYVTDSGSNKVIFAERFAGAPLAVSSTVPLDLTLLVTLT